MHRVGAKKTLENAHDIIICHTTRRLRELPPQGHYTFYTPANYVLYIYELHFLASLELYSGDFTALGGASKNSENSTQRKYENQSRARRQQADI